MQGCCREIGLSNLRWNKTCPFCNIGRLPAFRGRQLKVPSLLPQKFHSSASSRLCLNVYLLWSGERNAASALSWLSPTLWRMGEKFQFARITCRQREANVPGYEPLNATSQKWTKLSLGFTPDLASCRPRLSSTRRLAAASAARALPPWARSSIARERLRLAAEQASRRDGLAPRRGLASVVRKLNTL
jgi:hypothetical protein